MSSFPQRLLVLIKSKGFAQEHFHDRVWTTRAFAALRDPVANSAAVQTVANAVGNHKANTQFGNRNSVPWHQLYLVSSHVGQIIRIFFPSIFIFSPEGKDCWEVPSVSACSYSCAHSPTPKTAVPVPPSILLAFPGSIKDTPMFPEGNYPLDTLIPELGWELLGSVLAGRA